MLNPIIIIIGPREFTTKHTKQQGKHKTLFFYYIAATILVMEKLLLQQTMNTSLRTPFFFFKRNKDKQVFAPNSLYIKSSICKQSRA